MIISVKVRIVFKVISSLVAGIFLFQQIAWAGDLIDVILHKQADNQAQVFAPSYLKSQQTMMQGAIAQKQDVENFQNSAQAVKSLSPVTKEQSSDDSGLPLKGRRSSGSSKKSGSKSSGGVTTFSQTSDSSSAILNVTTQAGDVINYKDGVIDSIQKKDGTILHNIVVDADNNLVAADITFTDGTCETVRNGKVTTITKPDGTFVHYDASQKVDYVIHADNTATVYDFSGNASAADYLEENYSIDGDGNITTHGQYEQISYYDSLGRLDHVEFKSGKTIYYQSGVISMIVEPDNSRFVFAVKTNEDGSFVATISSYIGADGTQYTYNIDQDNLVSSLTVSYPFADAVYGLDGTLINVIGNGGEEINAIIARTQAEYEEAYSVYQEKVEELSQLEAIRDSAADYYTRASYVMCRAFTDLCDANDALSDAQAEKDSAQGTYDFACSDYTSAKNSYDNAITALNNAEAVQSSALSDLQAAEADVTAKQASYDQALQFEKLRQSISKNLRTSLVSEGPIQVSASAQSSFPSGALAGSISSVTGGLITGPISSYNSLPTAAEALKALTEAQNILAAKEAAYDTAVGDTTIKTLAVRAAALDLSSKINVKDSAESDLQTALTALSGAQSAKDASQAAFDIADSAFSAAQDAYNKTLSDCDNAILDRNAAKDQADRLLNKISFLQTVISTCASAQSAIADVNKELNIATVYYDAQSQIEKVIQTDGTIQNYTNGLPTSTTDGSETILYSYDLSDLNNITSVTVDRDGIKSIYDEYGTLESISLSDATQIIYENGQVKEIEKADGTVIKNMTFTDTGDLDSALISYPDGSVAVYQDSELLQIINESGDTIDYSDGKIRQVTLADGTVYNWSYDSDGNIVILDSIEQETRTYSAGKLIQVKELTGAQLTTNYTYDADSGNLSEAQVCKGTDVLYTYTYEYADGLTIIHDQDGNTQAYNSSKKLTYIIDSTGKKYSYTYVGKNEDYIEVYFPSGVKVNYDSAGTILNVTASDGTVITDITFDSSNNPISYTYVKDDVTYKIVNGAISEITDKDGNVTTYYDNGYVKSIESSLETCQYYITDSVTYKDASFFQAGSVNNVSYYVSNDVTTLALSANSLQFGNGSDGYKRITSSQTLDAGTYNFTSLIIDAGVTLTVSAGTVINCLGTVDIKGTLSGSNITINGNIVTVESTGVVKGVNQNITANTINNAGTMETQVSDLLSTSYDIYQKGGNLDRTATLEDSFAACTISKIVYNMSATAGTDDYSSAPSKSSYCAIYVNYVDKGWTLLYYSSGSTSASLSGTSTALMGPITGIRAYVASSAHADHDCRVTASISTLKIYSTPSCAYTGSTGTVPTSTGISLPSSGTFESGVIEIDSLTLDDISWTENLPTGTSISIQTRTGNTSTVDDTWTDWSDPMTNSAISQMTSAESKYIQFKITLTTTDSKVTPTISLSASSPLTLSFRRAPTDSSEASDISYMTRIKDGVTYGYNASGLLIWTKDASGNITNYATPDTTNKIDVSSLIFDYTYTSDLKALLPTLILNDTQKIVYMKDDIIVSELTAIDNADGSYAEYVQGKLSALTMADGTVISNITFNDDNEATDFTYVKDGNTYIVRDKVISEEITSAGEHIKYYQYGMEKSLETDTSTVEYDYGVDAKNTYTTTQVFQTGTCDSTAYYASGDANYLALSSTSLLFGTGIDGIKHVTANEALASGTYNFTSLTIDSGVTLTIASGVTINCLDTLNVKGKLKGDSITINANTITVESGAAISGLEQSITANTINNSGSIDNLCMAATLGTSGYSGVSTASNACDGNSSTYSGYYYRERGGNSYFYNGNYTYWTWTFSTPQDIAKLSWKLYCLAQTWAGASENSGGWGVYITITSSTGTSILINESGSGGGNWSGGYSQNNNVVENSTGWTGVTQIQVRLYGKAKRVDDGAGGGNEDIYHYLYEMKADGKDLCYANSTGTLPASNALYAYPTTGAFTSDVIKLDALTFDTISWNEYLPEGTDITVQTRTGDTATPDDTWSDWSDALTDSTGSKITSPSGTYLQYKITLTTTDVTVTPKIILSGSNAVSISYTKFSDSLTDPYVKVTQNDVTKAYNKEGVLIWEEDILGNKTTYDISNPEETIDLSLLKFDSTYVDTLLDSLPASKLGDAQKVITIYDDGSDVPVEMVSADLSITYFDNGYATEVVNKDGTLQVQYTYDEDYNIINVELVDARSKLEISYEEAVANIATQKDAALAKIDAAEVAARAEIAEKAASIQKQIDQERAILEVQKAQYDSSIYDLSGFDSAFAQLDEYQAQLNAQITEANATITTQIAAAKAKVASDANTAMLKLINDEYNKVLIEIAQEESSPIIYQYYRSVLGRDPSNEELLYWVNKVADEAVSNAKSVINPITPVELTQYLTNLAEYADREARKASIISNLTSFLSSYLSKTDSEKEAIATSLGLESSELVDLTQDDIDSIISWLNGQSLHFGDSAINTVISLLKSSGITKSFDEVGKDAIMIDILTGVITKATTGDLMISMYAMRKAAGLCGVTLYSQKITYADLKEQVANGPVIIHIDGKHYVIVTAIDDDKGTITYTDTTVGKDGTSITISRSELMQVWKGYELSKTLSYNNKDLPNQTTKEISATLEKNIRGSSWWSSFWKGICEFFQKILAPIATILLFIPPLASLGAIALGINIIVQTVSFVVHTGTLMDIVWSVVNTIGAALGATILPNIYNAVGSVFSSISNSISASLQGAFQSVMPIFNSIASTVKGIATGIGQIVTLGLQDVEVATSIGYNIISQSISLGVEYLFKSMDIDPTLSSIGGALFTGAIMGAITTNTNIIASALKYGTIAGVEELGKAAGLDSNITSLAAMLSGTLVGGALEINGQYLSYDELMASISKNIISECAYIGVTELGNLLGVDSRLSYIAGIGLRSTLLDGLARDPDTGEWTYDASTIWTGIETGLLQGVTSISLNYAGQEIGISSLLTNLGFSAISSAINASIQVATGKSDDFFASIFNTYEDNVLTFLGYAEAPSMSDEQFWTLSEDGTESTFDQTAYNEAWAKYEWQQTAYIAQIQDFTAIVKEKGIAEALNTYGTSFLNSTAVNEIVKTGVTIGEYFNDKLSSGDYTVKTLEDGTEVEAVAVTDSKGKIIGYVFFKKGQDGSFFYWDVVGKEEITSEGSSFSWGNLGVDEYGKIGYTDAQIYSVFDSDIQYQKVVEGQQTYVEIKDSDGNTLLVIEPTSDGSYNVYDSYGDYIDAKINDYSQSLNVSLKDGYIEYSNRCCSYLYDGDEERLSEYGLTVEDFYNAQVSVEVSSDGTVTRKIYWSNYEKADELWTKLHQSGIWSNIEERFDNASQWLGFRTNDEIQAHLYQEEGRLETMGQTGDIIFVNGTGIEAQLTKDITNGPVNHVAILYIDSNGEEWVFEMLASTGLQVISLADFMERQISEGNDIVIGRRYGVSEDELRNAIEENLFDSKTGELKDFSYNIPNLFGIDGSNETSFICSGLVEYIYRKAGKPIFVQQQLQYSPVDIYNEIDDIGYKY